jgi:Cu2+-exporting ATPase
MSDDCTLCGLPTPDQPITAGDIDGTFCCRGCLEVSRSVAERTDLSADAVRRRATESETGDDAIEVPADADDAFLSIEGMHCTTCEAFIGLRAEDEPGIYDVEASYATETARVHYDATEIDATDLPSLLSGYGYRANLRDQSETTGSLGEDAPFDRLVVGAFFAMLIMPWYLFFLYPRYVGWDTGLLTVDMTTPVGLYLPMGIVGLLAGVVVLYTGWPILRGAFVSLRTGHPNMDLLLSVAILSAYVYSTLALMTGSIHLYYDVSVAIVLVVTAGNVYEERLKRQATGALSDLTELRVAKATRLQADGTGEEVPIESLDPGDEVLVSPGERIPIDGTVTDGVAAVDEAVVSGESVPTTKRPGDDVTGGSLVTDDALVLSVADNAESTLDRITAMLWAAQSGQAGMQRFADRLSTVFVPVVLVLGITVTAWRFTAGDPVSGAVLGGLTVLVAACPCAMGLATPLAIAGGLRDALRNSIVVTNNALFEAAPAVETLVFDKTGTLTTGEMSVKSVVGEEEAVRLAAAAEQRSSHPIAEAITDFAHSRTDGGVPQREDTPGEPSGKVSTFERHPGAGVSAVVDGADVVVGTPELVHESANALPEHLEQVVRTSQEAGDVPVVVGVDGRPRAVLRVGDTERDDWASVLETFDAERVVLLSGDESAGRTHFSDHPAVDDVFAGVPPEGKAATVRRLAEQGPTAMIGDGTNDAPALAAADVGIAIAGTAHAGDAADVVIVDGSLADVPSVFDLARGARKRIRENIVWALLYNGVAIPLAVGGVLNPLFAAVAMAASSILVVTNSRRPVL